MKIEKLTENKIRVIINSNELNINNNDASIVMSKVMESQDFFLNVLKKAEKEVDFCTDGYKLLIELIPSFDDLFVFTITKYIPNINTNNNSNHTDNTDNKVLRKTVVAKRKTFNKTYKHAICLFDDFDVFCDFCHAIKFLHKVDCNNLINNSSLYLWKGSYYLVLKNINIKSENSFLLYSILCEFAKIISFSGFFEAKLMEYGEVIINKNAIEVGINFFAN